MGWLVDYTTMCARIVNRLFVGHNQILQWEGEYTQNNFRNSAPVQLPHSDGEVARKFGELMLVVLRTAAGSIPWPVIYKLNKGDRPLPPAFSWQYNSFKSIPPIRKNPLYKTSAI